MKKTVGHVSPLEHVDPWENAAERSDHPASRQERGRLFFSTSFLSLLLLLALAGVLLHPTASPLSGGGAERPRLDGRTLAPGPLDPVATHVVHAVADSLTARVTGGLPDLAPEATDVTRERATARLVNLTATDMTDATPATPSSPAKTASPPTCWRLQGYWPFRECAQVAGLACADAAAVWPSEAACCVARAAFAEGCQTPPSPPCFTVDSYYPRRTCRRDDALCRRGWGVYGNETACCRAGAAHPQGCN